mmetsp:Transcript_26382/g.61973  ORF Transcript_26382/g.61973 Transcript_26382/m.61973 type:complete len:260 (+) Transcript_26382:204-983(+)
MPILEAFPPRIAASRAIVSRSLPPFSGHARLFCSPIQPRGLLVLHGVSPVLHRLLHLVSGRVAVGILGDELPRHIELVVEVYPQVLVEAGLRRREVLDERDRVLPILGVEHDEVTDGDAGWIVLELRGQVQRTSRDDLLAVDQVLQEGLFGLRPEVVPDHLRVVVQSDHQAGKAEPAVVLSEGVVADVPPAVQGDLVDALPAVGQALENGILPQEVLDVLQVRGFQDHAVPDDALQVRRENRQAPHDIHHAVLVEGFVV